MKKAFILFLITVLSGSTLVYGQHVIRGRIIEEGTNEPLIGVTVVEFDANDRIVKGTITDVAGNYVINITAADARLQFSYIGYESQIIEVGETTVIDISLRPSTHDIEEIVVTATAAASDPLTGQSIRDRTTAVSRVEMDDLRNIGGLGVDDALQGQVSGLDIVSGGAPGSGGSIVIRGLGTLGNATPLIVVNGIPQDISGASDFDFGGADQEDIGQLLNIAPQDIKSVEVLKDAASTAVWGSRGADGVLLIETHRGSEGRTIFNYNYRFTINQQPPPIPMLNGDEYITMQLEQYQNARGIFEVPDEIAYNPDFHDFHNYSANTDWIDAVSQVGMTHDHFFKFSGGGERTAFYASLNASGQDGTTINEAFRRLSTRINLDYTLSRQITFSVNFDYTNSYRNGNYVFRGTFFDSDQTSSINIRRMAYMKAPNMTIMEHDQFGNPTGEYFTPINSYQGDGLDYFNPVAVANLSKNDAQNNTFQNSYVFDYQATRWLRLRETVSFQYANIKNVGFLPHAAIGADWLDRRNNESNERNTINSRISSRTQLILTPIVTTVHSLTGSLMVEVGQIMNEWSQVVSGKGPSMIITDPSIGSHVTNIRSNFVNNRSFGTLGSINYKYRDKYLLSANLRADASSSFGRNNRWGLFPSGSVGWRFSHEDWLSSWDFLNNGMLRLGYGQAGKEPSNPYDRFGLFVNANPNLYINNPAIVPDRIDLTNLRWETVESYNLGLELSFLNHRLFISGDLYDKVTSDILWRNYQISLSSGFDRLVWFNGGKIRNYGWEASLRYNIIRTRNLNITANFNTSRNINSFLEFPDNFNNIVGASIGNGVYPRMAQVGQPVGSFYGFRYKGVYSTSGQSYASDPEGNFRTDANGEPIPLVYANGYRFTGWRCNI
jgi:TonB-linked SusC/RagA family outer membrane protein